jgi:hypothetical protein
LQLWERETERGETRRKGKEQATAEPRVAAYTNTKDGLSLSVTGPNLQDRRVEMGWFWALVLRANALAGYVVCYVCMAMCLAVGVCNYVFFPSCLSDPFLCCWLKNGNESIIESERE